MSDEDKDSNPVKSGADHGADPVKSQSDNGAGKEQDGNDELGRIKQERDDYLAGWQRAKADFINYKKDEMNRLGEIAKYQTEDFIYDMLSVLDNFDLAIDALEKSGKVEKGIYMIRSQVEDVLKKRGLNRIVVSPGDIFDPAIAEAIAEVESDLPEGNIVEEIESGYRLYERVLRPVRVKISKGRATNDNNNKQLLKWLK